MVTLLTGPGSYAHLLNEVLRNEGHLSQIVSYFPNWEVYDAQGQRIDAVRAYRWLTWALWAVWRRIPFVGGSEHPRAWHFALYDWLTLQRVSPTPVLWAWWGTSLYTMRHWRQKGCTILLEVPACHPRFWNAIIKPIYAKYFPKAKHTYSILPENYAARLEAELKEAQHIQILSTFAKQTFTEYGVPPEKLHILPLGVDTRIFYPDASVKTEKGKFVALYVGRIDPLKGVQYLLEAFQGLKLPNAELWLVGPVVAEMEPLLAKYLGENVRYFGSKTPAELRSFYNQASVVVFPTLLDSFGMVILEAMACGKPVIATTHSGAPDILNGDEGKLVPPASVEALMQAIEAVYQNPEWQIEAGRASHQRVIEAYTLPAYQERIRAYLARVTHEMA